MEHGDLLALDKEFVVTALLARHGALEPVMHGVILQLVDHVVNVHEGVVHRLDLDIGVLAPPMGIGCSDPFFCFLLFFLFPPWGCGVWQGGHMEFLTIRYSVAFVSRTRWGCRTASGCGKATTWSS